ncbi:MAG TPA: hypothetical protein VFS09_09525 [Candidatus Eisenbacteria bacterium]|nr:hypothetical protein [Candidatus Eisenbacteria bacterium]
MRRRIIVMMVVAYAPLLGLSIAHGNAWGASVTLPFLSDLEVQARLLVVLPLLLVAELVVHQRLHLLVAQFRERGLIPADAQSKFDDAVRSAQRLRNSIAVEVALLAFVSTVGVGIAWRTRSALSVTSWYGAAADGQLHLSPAGWWLICVSMPMLQFLLLRWYFRLAIWARFLWQMSRIRLSLLPTHADQCGGLGFLALVSSAFFPLLLAQGALLSGMMARRVLYMGVTLPEFRVEVIAVVVVLVLAILGPLLLFIPQLAAAKRTGIQEYGTLTQAYARAFDRKWLRGGAPTDEPLIGSADIQSLADMGNSFEVVKSMRIVPFGLQTVLQLGIATLLPVLPLLLTMVSLEELLGRLIKVVF